MIKKFLFLIALSLLSNLAKSNGELKDNNSISKLISMVRTEIVDKSLSDLPRKKDANILQMVSKMVNAKKEYSLNEAESAYLVFKWISENLFVDFNNKYSDDPINAYNSWDGSPKALSSLFDNICSFLKVTSGSISGYLKGPYYRNYDMLSGNNYTWNYVEIEGEYYLLDVSLASLNKISLHEFIYMHFGTQPEIFIRSHFPNESKWQLLSEPYTFEKFKSMALLTPFFYLLDFKTISPDTTKISGKVKIILTSDKPIPKYDYISSCSLEYGESGDLDTFNGSLEGKMEIEYNIDREQCLFYGVQIYPKNVNCNAPIAYYSTNYTETSSSDFDIIDLSNSNMEYNNNLDSKVVNKEKILKNKRNKNIRGK